MKLQFLKNHGNYKAGDIKEFPGITEDQVKDLVSSGVVKTTKEIKPFVINDKEE